MLPQHGIRSGIPTDLTLSGTVKNWDKSDDGVIVLLRYFRPREIHEEIVKSSFRMFKDWREINGWYDSEPPPEAPEEGADPVPVEPKWFSKGKALAAFRSAIAAW